MLAELEGGEGEEGGEGVAGGQLSSTEASVQDSPPHSKAYNILKHQNLSKKTLKTITNHIQWKGINNNSKQNYCKYVMRCSKPDATFCFYDSSTL